MKIAVIGAGAAGLVATRHVSANGFDCDVYEMRSNLGGTWLYTDEVEKDEEGYPVYSATYKSLRANIPKEVMGFLDFPIPDHFNTYGTHDSVLKFLELYADNYNLRPLMKFNHFVTDIRPADGSKWRVTSMNKTEKKEIVATYDAVMLCTGNYNEPMMPNIQGRETFRGKQLHSQHYRTPHPYEGQNVLVVGAGPSGADLALEVSSVAKKVIYSHHSTILTTAYPPNVEMKPDVRCIRENDVEFIDGTVACVDVIFYCTGFNYDFPYLHESCGVTIEENCIQPLYKHLIQMERPSMCFVGIPVQVCAFPMFDLQARFYMKFLNGSMRLPSLEQMRRDTLDEMETRRAEGFRKKEAHKMATLQYSYYDDLARLAEIPSLPHVLGKVRDRSFARFYEDLGSFRSDTYKILDDENFTHTCRQFIVKK